MCLSINALGQDSKGHNEQDPTVQNPIKNPYYSREFYRYLSDRVQSDLIVNELKKILKSVHIEKENDHDELAVSCPTDRRERLKCYSQKTLGYTQARKTLMGEIYLTKVGELFAVRDVYCEHEYTETEFKNKKPGPGLIPDDTVVNCEHTWPQSKFNGRHNKETQKSDLHHLFPTDSKMNSKRSNFNFGEVSGKNETLKCLQSKFGKSQFANNWIFEPPNSHKGNVARALFYFSIRYDLPINDIEESFLRKWHQEDPVDEFELQSHERIFDLQENRNPFIDFPELVEKIENF